MITLECRQCGARWQQAERTHRRFCDACRAARKFEADKAADLRARRRGTRTRSKPVETPDHGRESGFACLDAPGRCALVRCRHHLGTDGDAPDCAIRVANDYPDGVTQEQIGAWWGITKEAVRQVEERAREKVVEEIRKQAT